MKIEGFMSLVGSHSKVRALNCIELILNSIHMFCYSLINFFVNMFLLELKMEYD